MLLELCWPKELKQAIAECRENGVLNEEAIEILIKDTRKAVLVGLVAFTMLVFPHPLFASMMLLFYFIMLRLEFGAMAFERLFAPYLYGIPKKVRVNNVTRYAAFEGKTKILCEDVQTSEEVVIGPIYGRRWHSKDFPKQGDIITVWHHEKGKKYAMPDVNYLKQKYSLRTTIL